jgi:pyruvate ferredoxin oxidoreductase alpha subunit
MDEVRTALCNASRVVVLEKALATGIGGIAALDVRVALQGLPVEVHCAIAGLGGRPITKSSLVRLIDDAEAGRLGLNTFVDLNHELIERELERTRVKRRSGPHAENMLRDVGVVAAGPV